MCNWRTRTPSSRNPSFSTTRRDAWFSGRMDASSRCRPTTPKQWSTAMASTVGMMPRPAYASSIQYPTCPDRAEPHVIDPTVSCPTNWSP